MGVKKDKTNESFVQPFAYVFVHSYLDTLFENPSLWVLYYKYSRVMRMAKKNKVKAKKNITIFLLFNRE